MPEVQAGRHAEVWVPEGQRRVGVRLPEPRVSAHPRSPDSPVDPVPRPVDPLIQSLDAERRRRGITHQELGDLCGMKRQQVSRLFAGSDPRISSFRRVAEAMGLSLGIFLEP